MPEDVIGRRAKIINILFHPGLKKRSNKHSFHSPGLGNITWREAVSGAPPMSTVLAQDRFFSDSLSFTLDNQDPQSYHDDVKGRGPQDSTPALAADLMNQTGER